jgi:hypothetical protein
VQWAEAQALIVRFPFPAEKLLHYFGLGIGMYILNTFGLWLGHRALLDSCSDASGDFVHADDASSVIIKARLATPNVEAPPGILPAITSLAA